MKIVKFSLSANHFLLIRLLAQHHTNNDVFQKEFVYIYASMFNVYT